jgi:transcriptional regulator with GAF, ATPase, and Fis domain
VAVERYSVLRTIGEGGSGRVLLVEDRLRPGSRLALKELLESSPDKVELLRHEFTTLASLRHPSLAEVHEFETGADGRPRFTMEWIDGEDLVTTLRREGPASFAPLAAEALRALGFLHDFGLVHRDLKPGNLLARRSPVRGRRVVVVDFGLAAERHVEAASAAMGGTLPYLAPELFEGEAPSKKSDLYALGVVLHEAVHGRTPFVLKGNDTTGFIQAVREGRRARPALPAGFPAALTRFLEDMIALDPSGRPTSATDALARLNEACGTDVPLETIDDRAARLGSGPPVGRDAELARLRGEIAPSDKPRLVWLTGDSGSGKSRLLRFLATEAIGKGWIVHTPPGALPERADAYADLVRADAAKAPTLVLLDEVERAEADVAAFLDRLAREPREAPVRVIAALRPGEVQDARVRKLLADTSVVPSLARVDLEPMDAPALRALIERATAGKSSSQARVAWLAEASEGNAGAAEALLVEGIWERRAKIPVAHALEQSIRRRMDALSLEGRAWLEALAVLGDDAPEALVAELSGMEEAAGPAAAEVIAAGLARRTAASVAPDSRRVAEAAQASTPAERLRQLHALAATHYVAQERDVFGATAWRLARLWRGAGETARAVAAALDAASAAEVQKEWALAAERYAFALRCLPRQNGRRGMLWWKRAEAARRAMAHREAAKAWGVAARLAGDDAARLDARAWQAMALVLAGQPNVAARAVERIRMASAFRAADSRFARVLVVEAAVSDLRLEHSATRELATQALALTEGEHSENRADALHLAMLADSRLDDRLGDSLFAECISICRELDLTHREFTVWIARAQRMERRLRPADQIAAIEEAQRLARNARHPMWRHWVAQQSARAEFNAGRYDRALSECWMAEELALYAGHVGPATSAATLTCDVLLRVGRYRESESHARHWLGSSAFARVQGTRRGMVGTLALALLENATSDPDEIRELLSDYHAATTTDDRLSTLGYAFLRLKQSRLTKDGIASRNALEELRSLLADANLQLPLSLRVEVMLAICRAYEESKEWSQLLESTDEIMKICSDSVFPATAAQASHLQALALAGLGRQEDARQAHGDAERMVQVAANKISDPDLRRDFLEQPDLRAIRSHAGTTQSTSQLEALYEMIRVLNSESDPEALLASILEMAMNTVKAERGMILLAGPTGTDFSVRLSRNLEKETASDAEEFSRRIVAEAGQGKPVLALDAGQDDRFKDFKSVSLYRIRSLMCAPLRSRGKIIGTVYLDSRRQGKPFTQNDLRFVEAFSDHAALALENAKRRAELESENRRLRVIAGERSNYGDILGRSPSMQRVFDLLERVAPSEVTVLIQGESGTGKELVARALHFNGPRKEMPFLSENCAALPETLLESELFGHVKGAFTGADRDRAGLFEQAHKGTLFLDEIGDTSPAMQARLLRVLQEGELRRVGGEHTIKVDVRVIAATNKELSSEIALGRFREDLYYRLAVIPVTLPPLRDRIGDVPFLAGRILERVASSRGRPAPRIDAEVLDAFERYPWPGNVRQLENLLRRVVLLAGDAPISRSVLESDPELARIFLGKQTNFVPVMSIARGEEEQIRRALEASAGHRDRAARLLGISRATIYRKMREYKIS